MVSGFCGRWNPRGGSYVVRRSYRALSCEERARIVARVTSRPPTSCSTGNRVLDDRAGRRIRSLLDSHCRVTETPQQMVTGLDALFLEVNNLEESLAFYQDQLGFVLSLTTLTLSRPWPQCARAPKNQFSPAARDHVKTRSRRSLRVRRGGR